MAKGGETFEHTADIGIRAWGDTLPELYEALAEVTADQLVARCDARPQITHKLVADAMDPGRWPWRFWENWSRGSRAPASA